MTFGDLSVGAMFYFADDTARATMWQKRSHDQGAAPQLDAPTEASLMREGAIMMGWVQGDIYPAADTPVVPA